MWWTAPRSPAVFLALVLTGAITVCAQTSQKPHAVENSQNTRIKWLLAQLAENARQSTDAAFRARAQWQAASLLWPHDRERARAIFRRVFESLNAPAPSERERIEQDATLSSAERYRLRYELLNQVAGRDSELAEEFARSLADTAAASVSAPQEAENMASSRGDGRERRELLVSVALQVVERNPYRAMALGQLSLGSAGDGDQAHSPVSPNFARLLTLMRAADPVLADLLFSSAVARLEHISTVDLADIRTLGSYLVSSGTSTLSKSEIVKFLTLASDQINRHVEAAQGAETDRDDSTSIYFIQRQLSDLFARYLPGRLASLKTRAVTASDTAVAIVPGSAESMSPSDVARAARESTDARARDSLNARAALAFLGREEVSEARSLASKVSSDEMRDRVLVQIARRQMQAGELEEAVEVARSICDLTTQVGVMVRLAGAALVAKDQTRAAELLNEAESVVSKSEASPARAQSLLSIAASFSSFDTLRAFEVTQSAVKAINALLDSTEDKAREYSASHISIDDLSNLSFKETLAALARTDFDRALLLAQQLSTREATVLAQLAVCRGGLTAQPSGRQAIKGETETH